jgi:hypothetical protein
MQNPTWVFLKKYLKKIISANFVYQQLKDMLTQYNSL